MPDKALSSSAREPIFVTFEVIRGVLPLKPCKQPLGKLNLANIPAFLRPLHRTQLGSSTARMLLLLRLGQ